MKLDDVIAFPQDDVCADFYGKVMLLASARFESSSRLSLPAMEATMRAAALIEAIVTGKIEIER